LSFCIFILFCFFFFAFAKIVFIYNLSSVFQFSVFPAAAAAAVAAFAVVNCNLKNITANCQNALTFTNYFAGSNRGVPGGSRWCHHQQNETHWHQLWATLTL